MNPFVIPAVRLITVSSAMATAHRCTTMDALQHAAFCRAQYFTSDFTDARCPDLIADGVSEGTRARLNDIYCAWPIAVIFKLQVLFVERGAIFLEFAAQHPQRSMAGTAAFSPKLAV